MTSNTRTINTQLLTSTLEVVRRVARRRTGPGWHQGVWRVFDATRPAKKDDHRCQTAMCFAGWVAELDPEVDWLWSAKEIAEHNALCKDAQAQARATGRPAWDFYEHVYCDMDEEMVICPPELRRRQVCHIVGSGPKKGTKVVRVSDWAQWKLGLDHDQAQGLFNGRNSLNDLKQRVSELVKIAEAQK